MGGKASAVDKHKEEERRQRETSVICVSHWKWLVPHIIQGVIDIKNQRSDGDRVQIGRHGEYNRDLYSYSKGQQFQGVAVFSDAEEVPMKTKKKIIMMKNNVCPSHSRSSP